MQTALDLRNELEDLKKDSDSGQGPRSAPAVVLPARRTSWARRGLWVGAVALVLAFAAWRARPWEPAPATPKKVAVTVFENRTGDSSLDPIGVMAAERLVQGVAETGFVEVLPSPVQFRDSAQVVSAATGAGTIVSGAYYLQGDELQFQASITNARDGRLLFPLDPVKGSKAYAAETLEPLRQRVMGAIAVSFDPAVFYPHAKAPRYDAYREYMSGHDAFFKDSAQAEIRYRRAIAIEPEYFWPQLGLYTTYWYVGQLAKAEAMVQELLPRRERYAPIERLSRLADDALSIGPGDVLLEGAAELRAHGHREESLAMARRAVDWVRARPPDAAGSPATRKALGRALFLGEEWIEAHTVFGELTAEDPNDVEATGHLGAIAAPNEERAAAGALSERLRKLKGRFLFGQHTLWRAAISAQLDDKNAAVDLLREAFAQGLAYGV